MTAGLDVFVQDVIAAMTTEPCSSSKVSPSSVTSAPPGMSATAAGTTSTTPPRGVGSWPGVAEASGSLAGKVSATASSWELP